jgi:tetratricopeptide (TPR) repeat protein
MSATQSIGGSAVDILFGRRRGLWSLREQLEGPLRQARTQFEANQFDEALKVINKVIAKDPQYPEALLLKGRILWEGFHNDALAKSYLLRTLALAPDDADPIHLQAAGLINDIKIYDGPTTHLPVTEGREQVEALRRDVSQTGIAAAIGQKARRQIVRTGARRFLMYWIVLWLLIVAGLLWRIDIRLAQLGLGVGSVDLTATQLHQKFEDQQADSARFLNTLDLIQEKTK